jgi:hypothetical protein
MSETFLPAPREPATLSRAEERVVRDAIRERKFRQAAFVYLHVALLYVYAAYAMDQAGLMPVRFGPPAAWLAGGSVVGFAGFAGLYWWRNVWFARAIWLIHGLRLPTLIDGAFFREGQVGGISPSFYIVAIVIILINLWMLARAAWDL